MASFGENLRREREMRGVTLEEISAATKISVRFLQAIEKEEFSKLPGGIFRRSFVRAYARYLGLEEEPVIAEFQTVARPAADVDLSRIPVSKGVSSREKSRAPLIAMLLAAAMLAGGYAIFRYSRRIAETPSYVTVPAPPPSAPTSQPQLEAAPAAASSASQLPAGQARSDLTTPAPSQPVPISPIIPSVDAEGGLVLQVAATEQTWVAIEADGRMVLQRVLDPNEVESVKAKEFFDLTTGNASGIILTLNGETLNPLGRRGEVKKVHLTRADLKNPAP